MGAHARRGRIPLIVRSAASTLLYPPEQQAKRWRSRSVVLLGGDPNDLQVQIGALFKFAEAVMQPLTAEA